MDGSWFPKAYRFIVDKIGKDGFDLNLALISAKGEQTRDSREAFLWNAVDYSICRGQDAKGQLLADLWEKEGFPGLNNDEKVMTRYRRLTFVTVLEIQKALDHQSITCIDLLEPDPKPFVVFDRSMSQRAIPYSRFISWVTHYPHYSRVSGSGLEINDMVWPIFKRDLAEMTAEEGEDCPGLTQKQFLMENYGLCCDLIRDIARETLDHVVRAMDVHQCVAVYRIQGKREEIETILEGKPEFEWEDRDPKDGEPPETEHYTWLRIGESRKIEKKMPAAFRHGEDEPQRGILGNVKVCADRLVVETFSKQKFRFAKKMIAKYFGKLLTLEKELVIDLAKQAADRAAKKQAGEIVEEDKPAPTRSSIPPGVEAQAIQETMTQHYRKFLDEKIPMLGGMTPREASKLPKMRPQLIDLMKGHLHHLHQMCAEKPFKINIE